MNKVTARAGEMLARFLTKPVHVHGIAPAAKPARLGALLQPADVILVEGHSRISAAIKYLTQSTWSHAALYIGMQVIDPARGAEHCFVEADIAEGVRRVGLAEFAEFHVRICRPIGRSMADRDHVIDYMLRRVGDQYDLRNVIDLARYLIPTPPVPARFRRHLLSLGSGDPTRAICSGLVAQAFQMVGYPILPMTHTHVSDSPECPGCIEELLRPRHHSLCVPRDFDVSPYFDVVKPALPAPFSYHDLKWAAQTEED
jgi:hypothetical protein